MLMLCMIVAATSTGALASVVMLHWGVGAMWLRYGLAVTVAYASLLAALATWVVWRRPPGWRDRADIAADVARDAPPRPKNRGDGGYFPDSLGGGGGGGGSGAADALALDEGLAVIGVVAAALALIAATAYLVYGAPALFAELLLDGVFGAALYTRLRHLDGRTWFGSALRKTWAPAAVVALFMIFAGVACQLYAPEARSLAEVLHHAASGAVGAR